MWARELAPKGITVNAVAPGPVDTDAMKENADDAARAYFLQRTPLGRIGVPNDIADVVAFLAAEARARELSIFPFFDSLPELAPWFARVEGLPGYERTYPPHWR